MDATPPPSSVESSSHEAGEPPGRGGLILRALSHRNYRLFFSGQLVSLVGSFLTQVATLWLVYDITGDPVMLGVVGFAGQIPMFVMAPFAGVWADRVNRRRLLVITQTLSMIQSFALAALALLASRSHGTFIIDGIIALACFQGLINAFDIPTRQAFLVEMVDRRDDLANAIALNSTMVHGARLLGPAIGGLLIGWIGAAPCFLLDGLSYIAVIAALLAMRIKPFVPRENKRAVRQELYEGLRYIWSSTPIRAMLLLMSILSLTGMPALSVLMPVFAQFFSGDTASHMGGGKASARMLGILMAASGLGALIAAIYLASRRSVVGLGRLIVIAAAVFGLSIVGFAMSGRLWLALIIIPIAGWGMLISFASANTLIQTLTEDHMRGRVMSFFTMAFVGMTPWGNLMAGYAAKHLGGGVGGAARTLMIEGSIIIIAALAFAFALPGLRKIVRPIYIRKGILPAPVASGLQTAADVVGGPEH